MVRSIRILLPGAIFELGLVLKRALSDVTSRHVGFSQKKTQFQVIQHMITQTQVLDLKQSCLYVIVFQIAKGRFIVVASSLYVHTCLRGHLLLLNGYPPFHLPQIIDLSITVCNVDVSLQFV